MSYYIIIRGPLGCGKSTISERLSKILSAKHISIDRVVDKLPKKMEEGFISQNNFLKANELAVVEAKRFLDKDKPVIFDGNFYWKSQIDDLIKRLDYPHYVFTLNAPPNVCVERDMKRDITHGRDAAEVVYKKFTEFSYGIVVDATQQLDECIKEIVSNLPNHISLSL